MTPADPTAASSTIHVLNIGTRILQKDTMDQYIRTLGDFKTHYASNLQSAQRAISENIIHVLITEVDYVDGCAYRLLKNLNWSPETNLLYVILAIEEDRPELIALAEELEAQAVLIKPFAASDLKEKMQQYLKWKKNPREKWQLNVKEGYSAQLERRYRDADQLYLDAVKSAPENAIAYLRAGQYFFDKVDYSASEKMLTRALELNPNLTKAMSTLGSLNLKKKDFVAADRYLKAAQMISPLNPDRLLEMVKLQANWSLELCKNAFDIDPNMASAKLMLGKHFALLQDYPSAIRELESAIAGNLSAEAKSEAQTFIALARKLGGLAK